MTSTTIASQTIPPVLQVHRSSRSQRLLTTLLLIADQNGEVSITSEALRKLMRSQPQTYRDACADLQAEGILTITGTGNFKPYTYSLRLADGARRNGTAN